MVGRQCNELYATIVEQRRGSYQERISRLLRKARKGRINVAAGRDFEDFDLLPNGRGCSLNVRDKGRGDRKVTKVLYIEHDDDNLYMLKMRLERAGDFEVLAAEDCEKGCKLAMTGRNSDGPRNADH
jgi:hypothetical protein